MSDDIRTIAEYRAAAEATGEWEQTVVDFSMDGKTWAPFILPTKDHPHPVLGRAIVQRKGRGLVETIVLWDESVPDDEFAAVWNRKPNLMLGSAAERAALRRTFPLALERVVYAERSQYPEPWTQAPSADDETETEAEREARLIAKWSPLIEACSTESDVTAKLKEIRKEREHLPQLEVLMKKRKRAIAEADQPTPDAEPEPEAEK